MNGRETYLEIRRINPAIKAIFASGYTEVFLKEDEIGDGRIEFLPKPVIPGKLLQCVRKLLDEVPPCPASQT